VSECLREAKNVPQSRTAILDCRFLLGNKKTYRTLHQRFREECLKNDLDTFYQERRRDILRRRKKFSNTVFLQEPNVKDSPGGLRDFHNLLWIVEAYRGTCDFDEMVGQNLL